MFSFTVLWYLLNSIFASFKIDSLNSCASIKLFNFSVESNEENILFGRVGEKKNIKVMTHTCPCPLSAYSKAQSNICRSYKEEVQKKFFEKKPNKC